MLPLGSAAYMSEANLKKDTEKFFRIQVFCRIFKKIVENFSFFDFYY